MRAGATTDRECERTSAHSADRNYPPPMTPMTGPLTSLAWENSEVLLVLLLVAVAVMNCTSESEHTHPARTGGWNDCWVAIIDLRSRREAQGDTPTSGVGADTLPLPSGPRGTRCTTGSVQGYGTKAIDRKRYRLPLSVQGVIPSRRLGRLSYRLSSRNRSSVEGEWFW
jgi:hypothetical protein